MDAIQPILAVFFVLALFGGTLYWMRRKGLARFSVAGFGRTEGKQMRLLERLPLGPQHSLYLVSIAGRTLLIASSPSGCAVVDSPDCRPGDK